MRSPQRIVSNVFEDKYFRFYKMKRKKAYFMQIICNEFSTKFLGSKWKIHISRILESYKELFENIPEIITFFFQTNLLFNSIRKHVIIIPTGKIRFIIR